MTTVFQSMDGVLYGVLRRIDREGHWVNPRRIPTKEITAFSFTLANPRSRRIGNRPRRWSESYAVGELCWHLSGSDRLDAIAYYSSFWNHLSADGRTISGSCYGKRIFDASSGESQWNAARRLLTDDPNTRRAVLHFSPSRPPKSDDLDVPCIGTIQFLIRNRRLDCHVTMRSCDVIYGLCYDVYFVTMLQELMCLKAGLEMGSYHQTTTSLHYYQRHSALVERILQQQDAPIEPMPAMSDLDEIPHLLRVERLARTCPNGDHRHALRSLSPYWHTLAAVLLNKAASRSNRRTARA